MLNLPQLLLISWVLSSKGVDVCMCLHYVVLLDDCAGLAQVCEWRLKQMSTEFFLFLSFRVPESVLQTQFSAVCKDLCSVLSVYQTSGSTSLLKSVSPSSDTFGKRFQCSLVWKHSLTMPVVTCILLLSSLSNFGSPPFLPSLPLPAPGLPRSAAFCSAS